MHIVMNMSSYEIESNSAQEENIDSMLSVDRNLVDVHLCLAERFPSTNKLTTLPANLVVANPDLFLQRMKNYTKITQ